LDDIAAPAVAVIGRLLRRDRRGRHAGLQQRIRDRNDCRPVEAESLKRKRIECDIHLLVLRDEPDGSDRHQQCHLQLRVVRHDGHERDAGLGVMPTRA
jgi:hypothetical protein